MFYKTAKQNNQKSKLISPNTAKMNILFEPKITPNVLNYNNFSRNLRKTNINFKSNLTFSQLSNTSRNKFINNEYKDNELIYFNINKAPSINDNNYKIN